MILLLEPLGVGMVCPRASLDTVESYHCQESNPGLSVIQCVAYSLYQLSYPEYHQWW
jgi:hypothetical protein